MKRIIFIIVALLLISPVLAINASSTSYTVGRFSTGMVTSNSSSTNYESLSLTESAGTTRNAESDTYTTNVGFFDNTPYYRTVSISSYSVYPSSSEVVSTIRLYISALNYESVWANITRPDGIVERVALSNNDYKYYTAGIVGRYDVIFYANSSLGAISSVVDYFDVTEVATPTPQPPGGGSSTTTIIEQCTYNWDCTPWDLCVDGKQTRECKNIGTCKGTDNKPIEEMNCSEALFDIVLRLDSLKINEDSNLEFRVDLEEQMGIEKIDVHIKYSIINEDNYEIFSQIETKAIHGKLSLEKGINEIILIDGKYILRVDVLYGNLQRAFAEQSFEVVKGEVVEEEIGRSKINILVDKFNYKIILSLIIIFTGALLISWIIVLVYNKVNKKENKKLGKKHLALFTGTIGAIVSIASLLEYKSSSLTGNVISTMGESRGQLFGLVLILIILLLILIVGNKMKNSVKITEIFERIRGKYKKKHTENMISDLLNKKVYSSEGKLIGKVDEIILSNNRIESLRITLDKSHRLSEKGIIVSYKHLTCVNDVIMIDKEILLFLIN